MKFTYIDYKYISTVNPRLCEPLRTISKDWLENVPDVMCFLKAIFLYVFVPVLIYLTMIEANERTLETNKHKLALVVD